MLLEAHDLRHLVQPPGPSIAPNNLLGGGGKATWAPWILYYIYSIFTLSAIVCGQVNVWGSELKAEDWLEKVEADMADIEIDRDDINGRKKWGWNVMRKKSNPIGKRTKTDNNNIYT